MKKRRLCNLYKNRSKKNVENSEIEYESETLTSNTREQVELIFNRLSFIQGLEAEAPVTDVGDEVP